MKTITFYSYKGGVGRTMALLNVAWRLAKHGKRIGIIDMDLEAPGMSLMTELASSKDTRWEGKGLLAYLRTKPEDLARLMEKEPEGSCGLSTFTCRIKANEFSEPGEIIFLPCLPVGKRKQGQESMELADYINIALRPTMRGEEKIDQPDPARLLEIQGRFEKLGCEYLLVDSRTGLCATSGLATMVYPQQVVVVLGLNRQNLSGTRDALTLFRNAPETKDIDFVILPSLVPAGEQQAKEDVFDRLEKMVAEIGLEKEKLLLSLALPYHPQLAVEDRPMLVSGRASFLAERYDQLATYLIAKNPKDPLTQMERARTHLLDAKSSDDKSVRSERAMLALREISHLSIVPPFDQDIGFSKLYGEVCLYAGFGVESRLALLHALELEAQQGGGKPTIKTALLLYEYLKEKGQSRPERIGWLQKIKSERFRAEGGDDDWSALYSALSTELSTVPPDLDGLIALNMEIAKDIPSFTPVATLYIANVYAVHGQWERATDALAKAEAGLRQGFLEGRVGKHVVSRLYEIWSQLCVQVRRFNEAEECLRKAEEWYEGSALIQNHIDLASVIGLSHEGSVKAQIEYLESVLPREGESDGVDQMIQHLANLYEEDGRLEDALRCRVRLFKLQPWDQRDAILRIGRLQERLGRDSDEQHEDIARKWVQRWPQDVFSTITLAELLLIHGKTDQCVQAFLDGAGHSHENADLLARAMRHYASERWQKPGVVDAFIAALSKPPFRHSESSRISLSALHRIRGQWSESVAATKEAAKLAATTVERFDCLTMTIEGLERLGRWDEAENLLKDEFEQSGEDVNWPHVAAAFYLRYAVQEKGAVRNQLFEKSLNILAALEARTGSMQLDRILPLRYHILVERLHKPADAERDLDRIRTTKYFARRDQALMAVPDADRVRFLSGHEWEKALDQTSRMSRYAHDTARWLRMLMLQANLQFFLGSCNLLKNGREDAMKTLDLVENAEFDQDIQLQELRLRCLEALDKEEEAKRITSRLWNRLKPLQVYNQDVSVLSLFVRMALRQQNGLAKAAEALAWIDVKDANLWNATAVSSAAIYHCCFGDRSRAEALLARLEQIGYCYNWLGEFLHDLSFVSRLHHVEIDLDDIRKRFDVGRRIQRRLRT
jgi:MinD-like ATPase involved in chromosome partitioning or flagellar assembly/tetratricopeptide (TPR) repeat protein